MRPILLIIILLSVLTGLASADTNPSSPSVSVTANLLLNANIEGLKALPVHNLNMIKAGVRLFSCRTMGVSSSQKPYLMFGT
jgi:hypothetical protein